MTENFETYKSYATRGIVKERLDAILNYAGQSILDVGCGSGAYVLALKDQYNISGLDYQKFETWEEAPELFDISDATELNLPDNSVETIVSFETIEHLPEPSKVLEEYYRVCSKNLIITVPNCYLTPGMKQSKLIYYHWIDRTHTNFFSLEELLNLLEQVGFVIEFQSYINQISLMPLVQEAFLLKENPFTSFINKILTKRYQKKYYLTSLVVAKKQSNK